MSSQPTESRASPLAESMERAGTTGAGLDLMSEGWNRSNYATAKDTWQYLPEVGLLVRKHKSPRTALLSPDMMEDCPIATNCPKPESQKWHSVMEEIGEDMIPGMKDHV